jgi:hypothetical protein
VAYASKRQTAFGTKQDQYNLTLIDPLRYRARREGNAGLFLATKNPPARWCSGRSRSRPFSVLAGAVSDRLKAYPALLLVGWRLCADFRTFPPRSGTLGVYRLPPFGANPNVFKNSILLSFPASSALAPLPADFAHGST